MSISSPIPLKDGLTSAPGTSHFRWELTRYGTIGLIGIVFLATIRDGHTWGDDFAQYLKHAENICHLRPYSDTGYIYNPQNAIIGPRAYPPGFPAALALVSVICGSTLTVFKIVDVLFFVVALLIAVRLFSRDLHQRNVLIFLIIVGFSPVYWEYKDNIASEHLFMPLWYATLLVADDWYRQKKVYGSQTLHGALLGLLIFLTCATRTVGTVLLPTIFVCEALIARRVTRVGVVAILTSVFLLALQRLVLPASGSGYVEQLSGISLKSMASNAYSDISAFALIWQNPYWPGVRKLTGLVFVILAAVGFLRANLRQPTSVGIALAGYFALIVVWPSADGVRMILPLFPGFLFYLLIGIGTWRPFQYSANAGSLALLVFSLISFGAAYSAADFGRLSTGVETPAAQELFEFIRSQTQPDEGCLFFKPRALALYTGRRSSAFPLGTDERTFWQYATDIKSDLIIVRADAADQKSDDQTFEMSASFASPQVKEVFQNSMFHVYRRTPPTVE